LTGVQVLYKLSCNVLYENRSNCRESLYMVIEYNHLVISLSCNNTN